MSDADQDAKNVHDDEKKTSDGGGSEGTEQDDPKKAESEGGDGSDDGDAKAKKPSIFSKPLFWIILIVIVTLLVVGAVLYWLHARQYESTDDAFIDAHIVRIAPQVSGKLIAIADADNRHVEAGRLLAVIDPGSTGSQLEQARADVVQARAQVAQAQAQVRANLATEAQAAVQARGPLAAAQKAETDLERYQTLLRIDPNAVAGQQLDQARATARSTAADAAAARKQVDTAAANVTVARKAVGAAQAVIVARQAAIDQAKVTIGYLRLTAPVSGQVVNRSVNLGSYVAPGTQLMAIVPDKLWVTANFKETQLTNMRIGQGVAIHVDAYPGIDFLGHVDSIQRGAGQAFALLPPQNATGNYVKVVQRVPVRILFDIKNGPDPRHYPIGPGMSVVPTVKVR